MIAAAPQTVGPSLAVLVVEDDEFHMDLLANALETAGRRVVRAKNGREALDILRADGPRLVISDWVMPEMDGLQFCRAVRSEDANGYVYIILLTGRDSAEDTVKGLSSGADDFVTKPFNPAELLARVHTGERVLALETREMTIFALAKLAESRDVETGLHLERVREYCRLLAQAMARHEEFRGRIDSHFIRLIYQTSPLHDIGKVGVPDAVLLKPGRLSDREFEIMKEHVVVGARTLEAALARYPGAQFLRMACDVAGAHHERFDGTGYPGHLKGDEIPLAARIMALADVYDALTSRRVYKSAFMHDVAASIIRQESGTHFDPRVVAAFDEEESGFLAVRKRHAEPTD